MYLIEDDLPLLNEWLNKEAEIAFIVPIGFNQFRAVSEFDLLKNIQSSIEFLSDSHIYESPPLLFRQYLLWHIKGGPLMFNKVGDPYLMPLTDSEVKGELINPWNGWKDIRVSPDPLHPSCDLNPFVTFTLHLNLIADLGLSTSSFLWMVAGESKMAGNGVAESTHQLWRRLGRYLSKTATSIPFQNNKVWKALQVYAFPKALEKIHAGLIFSAL